MTRATMISRSLALPLLMVAALLWVSCRCEDRDGGAPGQPHAERGPGDKAPARRPLSAAARRQVVADFNMWCADTWCEGPVSVWFHDIRCRGDVCKISFTAKIDPKDWTDRFKQQLPDKRAQEKMATKWRAGPAPVLDDKTYPSVPSVLVDSSLTVRGLRFSEDGRPGEEDDEVVRRALDAWRP